MKNLEAFTQFGKFLIAPDREVFGELRIAGAESSLYVTDDAFFQLEPFAQACITGILRDLTKVTLIQCLLIEGTGTVSRDGQRCYDSRLFPHYVLEGRRHISPTDKSISSIRLVLEDAASLFYDFDAFGTVINPAPYIEQIVAANNLTRSIPIGSFPQIAYFTGKLDILQASTSLGKIHVRHNPSWDTGGPRGVRIENVISVELEPDGEVTFDQAIERMHRLLGFLELIIGREQTLRSFVVFVAGGEHPEPLSVHWSHRPIRALSAAGDMKAPQPADLLLDPIQRQEEFIKVMRNWFDKDVEKQDARQRFRASFVSQRSYSIDRLVGAANLFDLLPESASAKDTQLSDEVNLATLGCRSIFKKLTKSYERDSVLSALGRVGKASLKHKTKHRAQYVLGAIRERFSDLVFVLDSAVDCRNHYVHGAISKIDYSSNFGMVIFFTDTLEFVFGASELVEAGWDICAFVEKGTTMSHPYGAYFANYQLNLKALKKLFAATG
jgi:ApeA N-terminal domain 1